MIYFLDGDQEVIKIVRSSAVISAIQTQELPEDNSLLRDYLSVRLKNDERLFNAQYMAIKTHGGNRNAFDLYRIASELVPDNATEFMGVQVAPYELEGVVIEDLRPQNRPLNQTMNQVLEGSDWRLGYVADNLPNVTTNFYYTSVKDALKKIQELTNVEMLFKVEISGNKITDKWVEVYHQLGNRTMKRFNYGTNALSVVRESSHDELYTALIGRGKGEEVGETESGDATYGRKINFADVEWKKSAGNPVDKPKGQKYIELPNATAEYGIKLLDGRKVPRIGIVEFNDTDDPEKLIQETYQELLVRARPKVLFKASVINTGDMLIGDTVTIHRHDLGFHYQARVRKVVRDRRNNNKTQVEIGDVVHTASTKRQGQINSALNNVASDLENVRGEVTEARQSADGKNTNFYGNVEPDRKKVGDTWFRDHPSLTGESQILVWNGEAWELIMDTSETTKNAVAIEKTLEEVEEAKQQAKLDAGQALADAKAHADAELERINTELSTDIGGAIEIAEQAKQDAIDKANQAFEDAKAHADAEVQASKEHFDSLIEDVETDVTNAQATADSAVEQINTAVTNAGFTSLDETISNMRDISSGILSEIDIAIGNAGFTSLDETINNTRYLSALANENAQTAISEAQTAQANSLTALGEAEDASKGVSSLNLRVDEVKGELEAKADNTFMNEDGTLTTLSNAITFNAHRFKSDMQRIESRVESLSGEINLVVMRGAFEGYNLTNDSIYPNPNPWPTSDTMRELIEVEQGEQLALTKITADTSDRWWRILFYNDNFDFITRVTVNANEEVITVPTNATQMWVSYPKDSQPQIVRGTDFIPYRPNLADQMTSDEVVLFRNEYEEFADGTQRRLTAIDGTGGRLDTAETLITETADGLNLTVGKVDSQGARLTTVETIADGLQTTVSNKASQTQVTQIADAYNVLVDGFQRRKNLIPYWEVGGVDWNNGSLYDAPDRIRTPLIKKAHEGTVSYAFSEDGEETYIGHIRYYKDGSYYGHSTGSLTVTLRDDIPYVRLVKTGTADLNRKFQMEKWPVTDFVPFTSDVSQAQLSLMEDSITGTVTDLDGRVTEHKQTLDTVSSTVYNEHESQLATLQLASEGIQGEVYNADGSSRVTQLANAFNVTVGGLTAKKNLIPYWEIGGVGPNGNNPNMIRTPLIKKRTKGDVGTAFSEDGERFTADIIQRFKADGTHHDDTFNASGVSLTDAFPYVRIVVFDTNDTNRRFQLEEDWYVTPYVPYVSNVSQAQISALEDNINLRVSKGDVINQINVSTEGILIDGKRTHITGTTTIDNGVIKNAHIANLNASKIDAGTINTARLNATEIVAQGLTAHVIKSTHLETSTATIDKLFASDAMVNTLTAKTAFIDSIKAVEIDASKITSGTIDAARINAIDIVTKGLTADVIESTHILADVALFDKLFTSDLATDRLSAKTAWIKNGMFANASIDGAKIQDATIGSAKIVDLDAGKISTGILDGIEITGVTITGSTFIQESSLAGSTYGRWDRTGITLRDSAGTMIMDMNREGINFHGTSTETAGTYINNNLIDVQKANIYDLNVTGINASLRSANFTGNIHVGNSSTGTGHGVRFTGTTIPTPLDRMFWVGYGYAGDGAYHYNNNGWRKLQNELTSDSNVTVNQLTVSNLVDASSLQLTKRLRLQNAGLQFTGGSLPEVVDRQMWIGYGYADTGIYVSLNGNWYKHGATISDARLKENIVDTEIDSLSAIASWNFVEFEWKDSDHGSGQQFGLIAQNTSHIANYYDEVDRWEIDSGKQTMMNSHAIQQLGFEHDKVFRLSESNEQKIHQLQQELSKANRRIEELESVM